MNPNREPYDGGWITAIGEVAGTLILVACIVALIAIEVRKRRWGGKK